MQGTRNAPMIVQFTYEGEVLETPAAATTHTVYCEREGTDATVCSVPGFEIDTGGGAAIQICAAHFAVALATGELRIA